MITKDLERLVEDLRKTDDEATVIQQYEDVLVSKCEVCCEFKSEFGDYMLTYLRSLPKR